MNIDGCTHRSFSSCETKSSFVEGYFDQSLNERPPRKKTGKKCSGGHGYMQLRVKAAESLLRSLAETRGQLEQANLILRYRLSYDSTRLSMADEHLLYAVRLHCAHHTMFSREALALMTKEKAHQISIMNFPPPGQWGENVLTLLKTMDMNLYRMILLDANLMVLRYLKPAVENGQGHPSYALLDKVVSQVICLTAFVSRVDKQKVQLIRSVDLISGQQSSIPESWWENVAKAIPPGLLTGPQRMDFIKAAVKTFQIKTSEIAVEKAALTEKLVNLRQKWPVDTLTYNEQMLRNHLGDDLEKVDEAAKLLNAIQDIENRNWMERIYMLTTVLQDSSPLLTASLMAASHPYPCNTYPVFTAIVRQFQDPAWTAK